MNAKTAGPIVALGTMFAGYLANQALLIWWDGRPVERYIGVFVIAVLCGMTQYAVMSRWIRPPDDTSEPTIAAK